MRRSLLLALILAASVAGTAGASPPVVALVGENDGVNVLHADFRATGPVEYPAGMPAPTFVDLPAAGTFDDRLAKLAAGPLGHLPPGILYAVRGTRLLFYNGRNDGAPVSLITADAGYGPRVHGTGVVAAAIGATTGTAPDALAVYVAGGPIAPESWRWIAAQPWIDVASVSGFEVEPGNSDTTGAEPEVTPATCTSAAEARTAAASGHGLFTSAGNTSTPSEQQQAPNGLPEMYVVGSTDATGRAATALYPDELDPQDTGSVFWATMFAWRFYDTGSLAFFQSAGADGFDSRQKFGATSGATPKAAGYALRLIAAARQILGAGRNGTPALATLAPGNTPPARGPLSDGTFTVAELERVLHHTAIAHEQPSKARYAQEGFGELNDASTKSALDVLSGAAAEPDRADEDSLHAIVEQARTANFDTKCRE